MAGNRGHSHGADEAPATVISLDDAPNGYQDFDGGVAKTFVLDPHGMLGDKHRVGA